MDDQLRVILIILVSVAIFGLLVFVFVKTFCIRFSRNAVKLDEKRRSIVKEWWYYVFYTVCVVMFVVVRIFCYCYCCSFNLADLADNLAADESGVLICKANSNNGIG